MEETMDLQELMKVLKQDSWLSTIPIVVELTMPRKVENEPYYEAYIGFLNLFDPIILKGYKRDFIHFQSSLMFQVRDHIIQQVEANNGDLERLCNYRSLNEIRVMANIALKRYRADYSEAEFKFSISTCKVDWTKQGPKSIEIGIGLSRGDVYIEDTVKLDLDRPLGIDRLYSMWNELTSKLNAFEASSY